MENAHEYGDPSQVEAAQDAWETAAVEHASTPDGRKHFEGIAANRAAAGDLNGAAEVDAIIRRGNDMRRANQAAARAIMEARIEANKPETRAHKAVATGRYTLSDDRRDIICGHRFACETHDRAGSCTPECVTLIAEMSGDDTNGVDYDPTGTSYGPDRPTLGYAYDANLKASVEYVTMPLDCLSDDDYDTVIGAMAAANGTGQQ